MEKMNCIFTYRTRLLHTIKQSSVSAEMIEVTVHDFTIESKVAG